VKLDFVYTPTRNLEGDCAALQALGAGVVWKIRAYGTRAVCLSWQPDAPKTVLAEHLAGERPILVYRVDSLETSKQVLHGLGIIGHAFEIAPGVGWVFEVGTQRLAVYELTRPHGFNIHDGRMDF
jgi:hypothetical protein